MRKAAGEEWKPSNAKTDDGEARVTIGRDEFLEQRSRPRSRERKAGSKGPYLETRRKALARNALLTQRRESRREMECGLQDYINRRRKSRGTNIHSALRP